MLVDILIALLTRRIATALLSQEGFCTLVAVETPTQLLAVVLINLQYQHQQAYLLMQLATMLTVFQFRAQQALQTHHITTISQLVR